MNDVLLKENRNGKFKLLAGLRLTSSSENWFTGSGVLHNLEADSRIRNLFFEGSQFEAVLTDNQDFKEAGMFQITALEFAAEGSETKISMALQREPKQLHEVWRMSDRLRELDKAATQGVWGQFSLDVGPFINEAKLLREKDRREYWRNHDTSHSMSSLQNGNPKKLAEFTHSDDAAFAEALVNAYRSGDLVPSTTLEATHNE